MLRPSQGPSRQLLGLDLVRFSAAAMVMAFHLFAGQRYAGGPLWGWVGVQIFFVLSGFVIAYSAARSAAGEFLLNRTVRLMPGVWICGSLTALLWALHGDSPFLASRYLKTLILWPLGPWVDGVYWTLPVEITFYALIFGLLALGLFRRVELLAAILALASTAYVSALMADRQLSFHWLTHWSTAISASWARLLLLEHGCYFALGVSLWLCAFERITPTRALIVAVSLVGGAIQIISASRSFSATASPFMPEAVWLLAVALICASAWGANRVSVVLGGYAGAIRLIGLTTYPLYLLHSDMGSLLRDWLSERIAPIVAAAASAALFLGLAFAVAAYLEPAVQRPLRSLLRRAARSLSQAEKSLPQTPASRAGSPPPR